MTLGNRGFVWSMEEGLGMRPQPMPRCDWHMLVLFAELPGESRIPEVAEPRLEVRVWVPVLLVTSLPVTGESFNPPRPRFCICKVRQ